MHVKAKYIIAGLLLVGTAICTYAQESLNPSKIQAKHLQKHPSLGLPLRLDGAIESTIWYDSGIWYGADSLKAHPHWIMCPLSVLPENEQFAPVLELCKNWASEKPKADVDIVYGPHRRGWYFAICKKIKRGLGWKTIAFVIPKDGIPAGKSIWDYSLSVNLLEYLMKYNLFPELPRQIQELVEEMTAYEHLCSFQEYNNSVFYDPDIELDFDWEEDSRDRM
ncbi:MAG: hypothetical protein ACI4TM_10835 [Candidatus Cryptobacteroides sp.]